MTTPGREKMVAVAKGLTMPAIVVVLYLIVKAIFGVLTEQGGLLTPDGSVSAGVAVCGLLVIVLRLTAVFVIPPVIVYRLAAALLRR